MSSQGFWALGRLGSRTGKAGDTMCRTMCGLESRKGLTWESGAGIKGLMRSTLMVST